MFQELKVVLKRLILPVNGIKQETHHEDDSSNFKSFKEDTYLDRNDSQV